MWGGGDACSHSLSLRQKSTFFPATTAPPPLGGTIGEKLQTELVIRCWRMRFWGNEGTRERGNEGRPEGFGIAPSRNSPGTLTTNNAALDAKKMDGNCSACCLPFSLKTDRCRRPTSPQMKLSRSVLIPGGWGEHVLSRKLLSILHLR